MTIEFWNLAQDELLHSLDVIKLVEDSDSISGLDFYATEAKGCKFEFWSDSWTESYLRNIQPSNCIGDLDVLQMTVKFTKNDVTRSYYIEKSKINYDKKNQRFKINGIDLLGLLLKLAVGKESFPTDIVYPLTLLTDTIDNIFMVNNDIQYSVYNAVNAQNIAIEDYKLATQHSGQSAYLDGEPVWGGNSSVVEGRWKYIGLIDGILKLDLYYKYEERDDDDETIYTTIQYRYVIVNDVLPILEFSSININSHGSAPVSLPETIDGLDPTVNQLTYEFEGKSYEIIGSDLYYTGDVFFDNIQIKADDDGLSEYVSKDIIRGLLLLNNIYIYAIGDEIRIGNKTSLAGTAITIPDADILAYSESYITFKDIDMNDEMQYFVGSENIANFLDTYYAGIKDEFDKEIKLKVRKSDNLVLLDTINVYDVDYIITKIGIDNDDFAYIIEAWSVL